MRFDFTDLNLFRHIVEAGSITHGAARANLALAAASTRIRKMELAFGTELLVRGRQGVVPTQAGRTLLQHARGILAQTERLQEDLTPYARGLAGQVRVLSNTNALTEFLPETLSSFLMAYPDISVDLEERLSDEIVGLMAEGAADIGIVAGTVDYGGLHTFPFRSDRFVLVVAKPSARQPLAHRFCRSARLRHGRPRPRQRDPALPRRQGEPHRPAVAAARAAALASTPSAVWSNAMSASASCRRPRSSGPNATWRSRRSASPTPGRCANCRSACATSTRCRLTRASWSIICGRALSAASAPSNRDRGSPPGRTRRRSCAGNRRTADPWWRRCAGAARRRRCGRAIRRWPAPRTRRTR